MTAYTAAEQAYADALADPGAPPRDLDRLERAVDAEHAERQARLGAAGSLAATALWYAARGIAVFPLKPRGKQPLLPSAHRGTDSSCKGECGRLGHGLYDATTDPDVVRAWWSATPQANIGVRTGLTFDVLDVDGPAGIVAILPMLATMPVPLGVVSTPRDGGLHFYVPAVPGRGNRTGLRPGLDYRGDGGYVAVPPSVTDVHGTGRTYRWAKPLNLEER